MSASNPLSIPECLREIALFFFSFCKQIIIISLTALVNLFSKFNLLLFRRKMFISCILFTLYTKIEMKKVEKWNSFYRRNLHCEFRQNQADNKIVVIKWKKAIKNHCTTGDFYKSIVPTSWKKKFESFEIKSDCWVCAALTSFNCLHNASSFCSVHLAFEFSEKAWYFHNFDERTKWCYCFHWNTPNCTWSRLKSSCALLNLWPLYLLT